MNEPDGYEQRTAFYEEAYGAKIEQIDTELNDVLIDIASTDFHDVIVWPAL